MKCGKVLQHIEDYHYGELDPRAGERVNSHLRHCHKCSEAFESLQEESRLFRAYARKIDAEVKPVLWEAILHRIRNVSRSTSGWRDLRFRFSGGSHQPPGRSGPAGASAAVILLISIAVGYRYLGSKPAIHPETPSPLAPGVTEGRGISPDRNSVQVAEWSIRRAEEQYIEAIEVLSAALSERRDGIDPELVASFERDVRSVDRNIAASRRAYRARPRDFDLGQCMLTAYARKLELLQTLGS